MFNVCKILLFLFFFFLSNWTKSNSFNDDFDIENLSINSNINSNISVMVKVGQDGVPYARVSLIQDNEKKYYTFTGTTGKAIILGVKDGIYNIKAVKDRLGNG